MKLTTIYYVKQKGFQSDEHEHNFMAKSANIQDFVACGRDLDVNVFYLR